MNKNHPCRQIGAKSPLKGASVLLRANHSLQHKNTFFSYSVFLSASSLFLFSSAVFRVLLPVGFGFVQSFGTIGRENARTGRVCSCVTNAVDYRDVLRLCCLSCSLRLSDVCLFHSHSFVFLPTSGCKGMFEVVFSLLAKQRKQNLTLPCTARAIFARFPLENHCQFQVCRLLYACTDACTQPVPH